SRFPSWRSDGSFATSSSSGARKNTIYRGYGAQSLWGPCRSNYQKWIGPNWLGSRLAFRVTMPPMQSKIAVAQMDCVVGDANANLAKIEDMAGQAKQQGAELVIFPELATTGYFISDRIAELAEPIPGPTTEALTDIAKRHD